ncbi:hypothetical protein PVK06_019523 [Gossypium arboreum]|uniref:Uncharacterized protein n=1 Tax=Gossypium arboreum TaxID=29729 RepID=A0ABR0PKF3_GOSAR|nr:hypothetical protein PVK06_019523 [Gossypium arboreum]
MRGPFSRMAVYVELEKPLVSQILINGRIQRIEFEALPAAYVAYGCYEHLKNLCPSITPDQCTENGNTKSSTSMVEGLTAARMSLSILSSKSLPLFSSEELTDI